MCLRTLLQILGHRLIHCQVTEMHSVAVNLLQKSTAEQSALRACHHPYICVILLTNPQAQMRLCLILAAAGRWQILLHGTYNLSFVPSHVMAIEEPGPLPPLEPAKPSRSQQVQQHAS